MKGDLEVVGGDRVPVRFGKARHQRDVMPQCREPIHVLENDSDPAAGVDPVRDVDDLHAARARGRPLDRQGRDRSGEASVETPAPEVLDRGHRFRPWFGCTQPTSMLSVFHIGGSPLGRRSTDWAPSSRCACPTRRPLTPRLNRSRGEAWGRRSPGGSRQPVVGGRLSVAARVVWGW